MPSQLPARCLVFTLEASPCLLIFITAFSWIFFRSDPPSTTVGASVLWMSPILVSTILAIVFIIQVAYDLVRSISCTGTICLSIWYFGWSLTCSLFDQLKPYNPYGMVALVMVLVWLTFTVVCSIPAYNDLIKLREIMKSGNLESYEITGSYDDEYDEA
ncbi:hypothetical protein N431DRAFT_494822 [Stipitochalara longipes BDJ]|nr:hypothetical protein N431DRAFT_494822 [Stipitochalara longipes BDJ]